MIRWFWISFVLPSPEGIEQEENEKHREAREIYILLRATMNNEFIGVNLIENLQQQLVEQQ